MFFYVRLNKRWENTWDDGDLKRYGAHYDFTVMSLDETLLSFK